MIKHIKSADGRNLKVDTEDLLKIAALDHSCNGNYQGTKTLSVSEDDEFFLINDPAKGELSIQHLTIEGAYLEAVELQPFTEREEELIEQHFNKEYVVV